MDVVDEFADGFFNRNSPRPSGASATGEPRGESAEQTKKECLTPPRTVPWAAPRGPPLGPWCDFVSEPPDMAEKLLEIIKQGFEAKVAVGEVKYMCAKVKLVGIPDIHAGMRAHD